MTRQFERGFSSSVELGDKMSILAPDELSNPPIVLPWWPMRYPTFLVLTKTTLTSGHSSAISSLSGLLQAVRYPGIYRVNLYINNFPDWIKSAIHPELKKGAFLYRLICHKSLSPIGRPFDRFRRSNVAHVEGQRRICTFLRSCRLPFTCDSLYSIANQANFIYTFRSQIRYKVHAPCRCVSTCFDAGFVRGLHTDIKKIWVRKRLFLGLSSHFIGKNPVDLFSAVFPLHIFRSNDDVIARSKYMKRKTAEKQINRIFPMK